jgi:hypothetical protein
MTEYEKKLIELWIINTELTPWCRIRTSAGWGATLTDTNILLVGKGKLYRLPADEYTWSSLTDMVGKKNLEEMTILWHPLYIGAVMDWWFTDIEEWYEEEIIEIIACREKLSLPFHLLSEDNQKAVCDLISEIKR